LSGKFIPPPTDPKVRIRVDSGTDRVTDTRFLPSHVTAYHMNIDIIDNQQYRDCCDEIVALPYDTAPYEEQNAERLDRYIREWCRRHDAGRQRRPNPAEGARSDPTVDYAVIRLFYDGEYNISRSARDSLDASLRSNVADNTSGGQSSGLPPTEDAVRNPELAAPNGNNQVNETAKTFPRDAREVAATGTANETDQSYIPIVLSKASHHPTVQGGGTADNYDGEEGVTEVTR